MLCEVTLSGFAGGEYLPLPASKGLAFPLRSAGPFGLSSGAKTQDKLCSPSMGTPLLQQIALMDNDVLLKVRKLALHISLEKWSNRG